MIDYLRNNRANFEISDTATRDLFKHELKHWKINDPPDDVKKKLQELFDSEPSKANNITGGKWKKLGHLNLEKLIEENRADYMPTH